MRCRCERWFTFANVLILRAHRAVGTMGHWMLNPLRIAASAGMLRGVADESNHSRASRIEEIEHMMAQGTFVRGATVKELARKWDTSPDYVRQMTAEASRRMRAEMSGESVAVYASRHLQDVIAAAKADDDHANVISALRLMADISGAKAPQRLEATVSTLTPEQARERLRELAPALVDALKEPT